MSVCNLSFSPDRILCITDTLVYAKGVPIGLCATKAHAVGDRFAWTGRGLSRLLAPFGRLLPEFEHVDEAAAGAAEALDLADLESAPDFDGIELTIMGIDAAGRLGVRRVTRRPGSGTETEEIGPGVHLAPPPPAAVKLPPEADADRLMRLSLAQWRAKAHYMNWGCIGGTMHLTTIIPGRIEQRVVGHYPDHDELVARFGREPVHA